MIREYFLEWLGKEIQKSEDKAELNKGSEPTYEDGILHALERIETIVQYGTFDEIIYVKLKDGVEVEGLEKDVVYEASSINGGTLFKVFTHEDELRDYNRDMFDIVDIECPYDTTKEEIQYQL